MSKSRDQILGDYQDRITSKKDRYLLAAERASKQSEKYFQVSKGIADQIPCGQPILVGHHSENRHRRAIDRIDSNMRKSVEGSKKAQYYAAKADSVGNAGIASDDPEAIEKLEKKLSDLETSQILMKTVNKLLRNKKLTEQERIQQITEQFSLTEQMTTDLFKPDICGKIGFASYSLSNNNATIKRTRERIEELKALHQQKPLSDGGEVGGLKWRLYEEDGRVKFWFDDKPEESIRKLMNEAGFRFSKFGGVPVWVRKVTNRCVKSAEYISKQLKEMD